MLSTAPTRWVPILLASSVALAGCARGAEVSTASVVVVSTPNGTQPATTAPAPQAPATTGGVPGDQAGTTTPATAAPTVAETAASTQPATQPLTTPPTQPPATTPPTPAVTAGQEASAPALGSGSTTHQLPTDDAGASWGDSHNYPAVDIFVHGDNGCGGNVVSPVNGTVSQIRTMDRYDPGTDNPAYRGGKSVTVIGNDGVRYYMSHLESIDANVQPGLVVARGDRLGIVGTTGRSGACHIHFGISPPCPDLEWSVRRGVIDPDPFAASWRDGGDASPVEAVQQWLAENPDGCANASAEPNAADA